MVQDRAERRAIDTHVHVWPLDDAPGHQPAADGKVSPPDAAAPVEWLLQDMAEYHLAHCVLVQSSAFGWGQYLHGRVPGAVPRPVSGLSASWTRKVPPTLVTWSGGWPKGWPAFRFHPLYYDREPRGAWWVDAPEHDDLWAAAAATGAILQFHMLPQHAPGVGPHDRAPSAGPGDRGPHRQARRDRDAALLRFRPRYCASPTTPTSTPRSAIIRLPANKPSRGWTPGRSCACWPPVSARRACSGAPAIPAPPGSSRWRRPLRYIEQELPLTPDERRQILWDTPARLFGFPATED